MDLFRRRRPSDPDPLDQTRMKIDDPSTCDAATEEQHDVQDLAEAHERLTALRYRFGAITQSARGPQ